MSKYVCIISLLIISSLSLNARELKELRVKDHSDTIKHHRNLASTKSNSLYSTRNLAWTTMALLGATALTGREQKANPVHLSLASLSMISYGFFMHSYLTDDAVSSQKGYKWASYSKWLHIPAMLILPIAGAVAQRHFAQGKTSATGIGSIHKPAALAAVIGMALTTLSLTFEF